MAPTRLLASLLDRMPSFRHQNGSLEADELHAISLLADGADGDDALRGP
jgi:hypothetical protein